MVPPVTIPARNIGPSDTCRAMPFCGCEGGVDGDKVVSVDGGNVDGGNVDGGNVDGGNVDGGNVDGGNVDGDG